MGRSLLLATGVARGSRSSEDGLDHPTDVWPFEREAGRRAARSVFSGAGERTGKSRASSLVGADPRHEPKGKRDARGRERWPADLPVVEEIIDPREVQKAPEHWPFDRCGGERTTRLRTRPVPASAIGAARGRRNSSCDRGSAAEPAGALHCGARTSRADHRQQVLRSSFCSMGRKPFLDPPWGSSAASEHGPLDGNGSKATRRVPRGPVNVGGSVTRRVVRRLSIRPPLLSICPPVLSIFDARLVADAGGEKRASRSGCQGEQERSCDPLSGNRGEGGFHTI